MTSLFEQKIERHIDDFLRSDKFKSDLSLWIKWAVQGLSNGKGIKDREAFTTTVAARIRHKARRPIYLFGRRVWRARMRWQDCREEAERIVTDFLRDEKIKFGDSDFCWKDGRDIADEAMSYWEACP